MNYCEYLLTELNAVKAELAENDDVFKNVKIKVTSERTFKSSKKETDGTVILFVVKNLTGSFTLNIKTQPFQIIVYSELNTFYIAQQILELFVIEHKNGSTDSIFFEDGTLFKQDYDTPVALKPILETDIGFRASFYCFGTYVECANLSDIVGGIVYHYGTNSTENVNYISAQFTYAAVLNTAKESGEELSISLKQEAGLTLSMTLMNDNSQFVQSINKVMLGKMAGNTRFTLSFTVNNIEFSESFVISDASFTTDRKNAPGLSITLTR